MSDKPERHTLAALATERWRYSVNVDENEAIIWAKGETDPRIQVGPLATLPLNTTEYNEDDECDHADLTDDDGRNLAAIACLPQFAKLIGVILGGPVSPERWAEVLERANWIRRCIDDRDRTAHDADECGIMTIEDLPKRPR